MAWPTAAAPGGIRADPSTDAPSTTAADADRDDPQPDVARGSVAQRLRAQAVAAGSPDDAVDPADVDLDGPGLSTTDLLAREFGAEVIENRPHVG